MATSSAAAPVNIVTLKWGTRYGPHYVNRLLGGVRRGLGRPFRFVCLTDDRAGLRRGIDAYPLPALDLPASQARSAWLKLGLFADGLADMTGDCLFLDLDLAITGGIDCFFDFRPGDRCIVHNWLQRHMVPFKRRPDVGNSSVLRWRANTTQAIVDTFLRERDRALADFRTEQAYLTQALGRKRWWPESWVRSFKRHAVPAFPFNLLGPPRLPAATRILVFHGRPDPDEALAGYRAAWLHRRTRPAPWIAEHWREDDAAG